MRASENLDPLTLMLVNWYCAMVFIRSLTRGTVRNVSRFATIALEMSKIKGSTPWWAVRILLLSASDSGFGKF